MSGDYVCSLSEKTIEKAKKELNEEPKERLGAVQALREWIERESWITSPTDTLFLLAFLRVSKFSQLKTRDRLSNFLSYLKKRFQFIEGHDPADPKSLEILRDGMYVVLPGTDKDGRRVILCRGNAIDTSGRYTFQEYMIAVLPLFHSLMFFYEEQQVNGMTFLVDYGGVKMSIITWIGLDNMRHSAEFINVRRIARQEQSLEKDIRRMKAYPARLKSLNYYNTGAVFEAVMEIFKPLLSKKLRERVHVHHTMVSVYEQMGMSILPVEYLPDEYTGPSAGRVQDIIEDNINEFLLEPVKREWIKNLYSGIYYADLAKKPTEVEATASFRKLTVS